MDQLIPMISQKVIESIKPTLKKMVDDSLLPHIEKIQIVHHVINLQREEIDKQNTIIQTLQDKLDKVETEQLYHLVLLNRVVDQSWMQVY
jgi:GTPase involved in cell partitioning and DNA repair